jgi:hypothetical protein
VVFLIFSKPLVRSDSLGAFSASYVHRLTF